MSAGVIEIEETIQVPTTVVEDVEIVYWRFQMSDRYGRRFVARDYWMATREDGRGRLYVGFFAQANYAVSGIQRDDFATYARLHLPWVAFERAARQALDNQPSASLGHGRGGLFPYNHTWVRFRANCGETHFIRRTTLRALIAY